VCVCVCVRASQEGRRELGVGFSAERTRFSAVAVAALRDAACKRPAGGWGAAPRALGYERAARATSHVLTVTLQAPRQGRHATVGPCTAGSARVRERRDKRRSLRVWEMKLQLQHNTPTLPVQAHGEASVR
jgi:pyocin large subunit-like protein